MRRNESEYDGSIKLVNDCVFWPSKDFDSYGRVGEIDDFERRNSGRNVSFDGKPQESPEELQARGEGSGKAPVCQKM